MCDRYAAVPEETISACWAVHRPASSRAWTCDLTPRASGPFVRQARSGSPELVVGQWGLIPWFAKEARLPYQPANTRLEALPATASYEPPWERGQRCIIPAQSFDELCWDAGRYVWWRFRRADGEPWALAGLWNTWEDQETGEVHESYTMLTVDAHAHPLMGRLHRTSPWWPSDGQDQRSVLPLEADAVVAWLTGTPQEARAQLRLPPPEQFEVEWIPV